MKRIIAIDPGASGGIADMATNGHIVAMAMPSESDYRDYMEAIATGSKMDGVNLVVFVEQVGGFIKGNPAPGSAMFRFGDGYGFLRAIPFAYHVEVRLVRPQTWQAGISGLSGVKGVDRKRALKEHAARIYPNLKVTLSTCDALLILDWARRQP